MEPRLQRGLAIVWYEDEDDIDGLPPLVPGSDRVLRLLKAMLTVDEFLARDIVVHRGAYAGGARTLSLEFCRKHWAYVRWQRPIDVGRPRWCQGSGPLDSSSPRGCTITSVKLTGAEKDRVEISHRGEIMRAWYAPPSALRDPEDIELYKRLRDRGSTPDQARNTILGMGHEAIDRLLAQLRANTL